MPSNIPYCWNPNLPSVDAINQNGITSWSGMTDGTKTACTGVEVSYSSSPPNPHNLDHGNEILTDSGADSLESNGWRWDPCY